VATLTTRQASIAGASFVPDNAAAGGDLVACDDRLVLYAANTSGAPITITVATPNTISGLAIADTAVSVPATTGVVFIGPLVAWLYADPADGFAHVTYSASAGLKVAPLRV
jgi:hypothetical protein